jgi:hypothetical protein
MFIGGYSRQTDCCGSRVGDQNRTKGVHPFDRISVGYSFYKARRVSNEDLLSPNKISTLRVSMRAKSSLNIHLEWTAPGGDQDFGAGWC